MTTEPTDRLAAAKLRLAEAEAARAERLEADAEARATGDAERAAADAEALDAAEQRYPKVATVAAPLGLVIMKPPSIIRLKKFRDNSESTFDEVESFVRTCLVHPGAAEFQCIIDDSPGTIDRCGNAICELAGYKLKELQGKS